MHRLGRGGHAGDEGHAGRARGGGQLRRQAGADAELGAGVERGFQVGAGAHGTGADDGVRHFVADAAHRGQRGLGAQRDFQGADAAGDQCAGEIDRDRGVVDHDHRHHRALA
ncbi:hypothetical protein D3C72_2095660 [compost metagenome]